MTNYAKDKRFEIPSAFTALNGAAQTIKVTTAADLVVAENASDIEKEVAQRNLLRVLEVLRSNGAQPIVTSVEGKAVTFTVEQVWVYGKSGDMQVSEKDHKADAEEKIGEVFGNAPVVAYDAEAKEFVAKKDEKGALVKLFDKAEVLSTIGALV